MAAFLFLSLDRIRRRIAATVALCCALTLAQTNVTSGPMTTVTATATATAAPIPTPYWLRVSAVTTSANASTFALAVGSALAADGRFQVVVDSFDSTSGVVVFHMEGVDASRALADLLSMSRSSQRVALQALNVAMLSVPTTPAPTSAPSSSLDSVGIAAGIVVVLIAAGLIGLVVYCVYSRYKRNSRASGASRGGLSSLVALRDAKSHGPDSEDSDEDGGDEWTADHHEVLFGSQVGSTSANAAAQAHRTHAAPQLPSYRPSSALPYGGGGDYRAPALHSQPSPSRLQTPSRHAVARRVTFSDSRASHDSDFGREL